MFFQSISVNECKDDYQYEHVNYYMKINMSNKRHIYLYMNVYMNIRMNTNMNI